MPISLDQIESRIQQLVEISLPSILPGARVDGTITRQLAGAVRANLKESGGKKYAPNLFTIITRAGTQTNWQDPRLLNTLRESLHVVCREAGLDFAAPPSISLATDDSLPAGEVRVLASYKTTDSLSPTAAVTQEPASEEDTSMPENAFLIVDGRKVFPLNERVVNIGRRLENHLAIDDPRISRNHTQLRAIKGRFVVFDLNSTGGTFVNGQRVSQTILYPGDVLSLAGVTLVYGQDNPPPRPDLRETGPLVKGNSDRPTAILKDRTDLRIKRKK